jgi:uncharacterized membrane protein HdeD (DUF308 family)
MASGITLIVASILLFVFPQLLAYILAACLLIVGINLIINERQQRRMFKVLDSPDFEVFMRTYR